MKATPFNQKTIAEFDEKQGRGVGMWGDPVYETRTSRLIPVVVLHPNRLV